MSPRRAGLLGMAAGLALGVAATLAGDHAVRRAAAETALRDQLLGHPEIIPDVLRELRAREAASAIRADRGALQAPFAGAWAGNPRGDVTLVMFTDYACGYCRASAPDIDRLLAGDPRLKVVWREIPVLGPDSEAAARVALAAAGQGRYLAFHRALFAAGRPDAVHLADAARTAGLDVARIKAAGEGPDVGRELDRNLSLATRLGIDGTPAFVIGDELLSGAVGYDRLAQAVAAARRG